MPVRRCQFRLEFKLLLGVWVQGGEGLEVVVVGRRVQLVLLNKVVNPLLVVLRGVARPCVLEAAKLGLNELPLVVEDPLAHLQIVIKVIVAGVGRCVECSAAFDHSVRFHCPLLLL